MEKATFAGGCFWGIEEVFRIQPGVISTQVGYTGGHTDNPSYEDVCKGGTGHAEATEIIYDPSQISYIQLLKIFFENHNPTTKNHQGPDVGEQYRSAIFCHTSEQLKEAFAFKHYLENQKIFAKPIVTEIVSISKFYPAEDYHQKYLQKKGRTNC